MLERELLIEESLRLIDALHQLDETSQKVLFVVRGDRLVAALSDGDVRRHIMRGGALTAAVSEMANYRPKFLPESRRGEAEDFMRREKVFAVPVVDADMRMRDIVRWAAPQETDARGELCTPVVINAGGKGTRLYPYTKILPKALIPIGEIPISEHIINRFYRMGCERFYMIVNEKRNMIKAYFSEVDKPYTLAFMDEETPLGTGGGLKLLAGTLTETFIFANCDTIIDQDFAGVVKVHRDIGNAVTMICATKSFTFPYGIVETGENGAIQALREKPQMTYLTNTGCYIVEPRVIEQIGDGEAISFPDVVERCRVQGMRVGIYPVGERNWLDMGQFDTMEEMRKRMGLS